MKYFLFSVMLIFISFGLKSQVTTSEIKGLILDQYSEPIPGAQITVTHIPTRRIVYALSAVDGNYFAPQLIPGGPYTLSVKSASYQESMMENIFLNLGEVKMVTIQLVEDANQLKEIIVDGNAYDSFSNRRKGAETNISDDEIRKLPTINRSLQDMTRHSPQAAGNSYAGSNYRYNNLSIDGVANNDAFGFQEPSVGAGGSTAAGSPGALSRTQPISLDAVSEIQIATSPYDVKLGNFTGGSLNVVTKSGTNQTHATVYSFLRNSATTGKSAFESRERIESFYNLQSGLSLGGSLKKNKLFYFVNLEIGRSIQPLLFEPGSEGSIFSEEDISNIFDTLQTRYNFDAGTFGEADLNTENNKAFIRLDYHLNSNHVVTLRHNLVQASHENLSRSGTIFNFGSQGFTHNSLTNSTVLEVKSKLKSNIFNNLIVGMSTIRDFRAPFQSLFPHIEITYQSAGQIFIGSYREASIFQMNQTAFELSDHISIYKNKHKLTFGTHNELYQFKYHFVTPYTGRWAYANLADFYNNSPSRVRGTYNLTDDSFEFNFNRPSADFPVLLSSFYAQDEYTVSKRLSISYGVRLEGNVFLNDQNVAPDIANHPVFGKYTGGVTPRYIIAPRFGFNYDLKGDNTWKLRGGSGIFAGRMPFAWGAYSYIYNGAQFGSVDVRPDGEVDLITENYSELSNLQENKREINLIDPDFKLPRVWRSSLATDLQLPANTLLTVEAIFTQTIYDIFFQNVNLNENTTPLTNAGSDQRPINIGDGDMQRIDSNYANVFLLTNTQLGYKYSISASLEKKIGRNILTMAAYTYGMSKDLMNGVRVSAQANWNWNQTIEANNPRLSYSNFDIRHRIISNLTYASDYSSRHKTTVGAFFIASSGSPFSYVYSGDLNRDASSKNDLIYVPNSASEINLIDITNGDGEILVSAEEQWNQLNTYIENDSYLSENRGKYTERNGGRTPWNIQLDIHIGQELKFNNSKVDHQLELTADVFNVLNLFNYRWGRQYFVPNTTNSGYALITAKSNSDGSATTYQFFNPKSAPWQIDGIASRLQMQIGLRYSF